MYKLSSHYSAVQWSTLCGSSDYYCCPLTGEVLGWFDVNSLNVYKNKVSKDSNKVSNTKFWEFYYSLVVTDELDDFDFVESNMNASNDEVFDLKDAA